MFRFNRINVHFDEGQGVIIINAINMEQPIIMEIEESLKDKDIVKLLNPVDIFKIGMYCSQHKKSKVSRINEGSIKRKIRLIEFKEDGSITYKVPRKSTIERDHINHVVNSKELNNFSKNDVFKMGLMTGIFTRA